MTAPARPIEEAARASLSVYRGHKTSFVSTLTIHAAPTIARPEYKLSAVATQIRGMATKPIGNTKYSRWKTTTRTAVSRLAMLTKLVQEQPLNKARTWKRVCAHRPVVVVL